MNFFRCAMKSSYRSLRIVFSVIALALLPGCLSLGGKTVYTSEAPQTSERLSVLENRVSILEQAVANKAAPIANANAH